MVITKVERLEVDLKELLRHRLLHRFHPLFIGNLGVLGHQTNQNHVDCLGVSCLTGKSYMTYIANKRVLCSLFCGFL